MNDNNQSYEDFISTVSHELRTPLTSIRGFSQTMLASWDKLDDASKKKFIKIIEEQSNRLINLVENMLAVTKLQSKNIFVYNQTDIKPIIEQTIIIINNKYKSQIFRTNYSKNLPEIFVDKDKFQQIMTNLLENSAKYSPDNSVINISVSELGEYVEISVTNKGIPISPNDYSKIFEKFSRIDNPLTRSVQGSGLGLFITKNLVEKMGGIISVKSEPMTESDYANITFTVAMPIKNIEEQAKIKCKQ